MTPRGSAPLIEMRQNGMCPSGSVWVKLGDFREPDWWRWANTCDHPEILVRPEDPIERLDLRCLVGLDVLLFFGHYDERAGRLYEKLQDYAKEIAVMSPAFEDDIGWRWVKDVGRIEFDASLAERRAA